MPCISSSENTSTGCIPLAYTCDLHDVLPQQTAVPKKRGSHAGLFQQMMNTWAQTHSLSLPVLLSVQTSEVSDSVSMSSTSDQYICGLIALATEQMQGNNPELFSQSEDVLSTSSHLALPSQLSKCSLVTGLHCMEWFCFSLSSRS